MGGSSRMNRPFLMATYSSIKIQNQGLFDAPDYPNPRENLVVCIILVDLSNKNEIHKTNL